jgi:hypothetical protein
MNDTFSADGAKRIARNVERYWRKRGHQIEVRVEPVPGLTEPHLWQVRSNLVGGLPPYWGRIHV